jgi:hypothetical protein
MCDHSEGLVVVVVVVMVVAVAVMVTPEMVPGVIRRVVEREQ